jgi:phage-related baseplate assembly protein
MLLRSVLADMVQLFAGVDNALRMQTLRYAVGEYLDVIGENRGCERIPAVAAETTVTITTNATGNPTTLDAGTAMTADGKVFYALTDAVALSGYAQTLTAAVICTQAGTVGNGLQNGTTLHLQAPVPDVSAITAAADATGGQDEEEDDVYRERIRQYGLASVTTGPASQYESAARAVSSVIVDAKALNLGAGSVGVYLILSDDTGAAALIDAVEAALNAQDVRPLTDSVTVLEATDVTYTLNVLYETDSSVTSEDALEAAAEAYRTWQDNAIGRAFNPDRLMAMLYQAGATRVIWDSGSAFDGGTVEYTEIAENERCLGTITLTAM